MDIISEEETQQLARVRQRFLDQAANDSSLFYPQDVELVQNDEWWTLRFVKWNRGNEEKALKQMINAFKWRKSFGLHDRNVNDIPNEFAKAAAIFPLGFDHKGRPVTYIRVKVYRKIQDLTLFFQQFVAGIINHVDILGGRKGFVIVFDISGLGICNFDLDFIHFLIQLLQTYYPYGLRYSLIYNLPRMLRHLWLLTKIFLGGTEKTFGFCNTADELKQYIPAEWLPRYMGGESDFDFTDFEEVRGAPSVREIAPQFGFGQEQIEKFIKMFEVHFKEAKMLHAAHVKEKTSQLNA